jgi:hypothetical protein
MMSAPDNRWVSVASLTHWGVIELRNRLHLVGILIGGHPKIDDGVWLISSPLRYINDMQTLAVTASRRCLYQLRKKFEGPWPEEAMDLINGAIAKWGITAEAPAAPIPWEILGPELMKRGLTDAIDPGREELTEVATPNSAGIERPYANGSPPAAAITQWAVVELCGELHIVGVHEGGHERLRPGHWMITSPVRTLLLDDRVAITASAGRCYRLRGLPLDDLSYGAIEVIADVMERWGIDGPAPERPIAGPELRAEIAKRGLDPAVGALSDRPALPDPEQDK